MVNETKKPWGSYTNILDETYTKVKKIMISRIASFDVNNPSDKKGIIAIMIIIKKNIKP